MMQSLAFLNSKSSILYPFPGVSRVHVGQKTQISFNRLQISGSKVCSSSLISSRHGAVFKNLWRFKMEFSHPVCDGLRVLAVSDSQSGGVGAFGDGKASGGGGGGGSSSPDSDVDNLPFLACFMRRLESLKVMISSIWWMLTFYRIVVGGKALLQDSLLYWSTLAFDMFYKIICIGIAYVIFIAFLCCFPILAIAYAISMCKGTFEDVIKSLRKYRYCQDGPLKKLDNEKQEASEARVGSSNNELTILPEDSECCICLARYVDGEELYTLPCNHHFHCTCISKWLRVNATCPLCKFNIRRGDALV